MRQKTKNSDKDNRLAEQITGACRGLNYMSEGDAAVLPFFGGKVDAISLEAILKVAGRDNSTEVEETSFDDFFARVTAEREWFTARQKQNAARFAKLQKLLGEHLMDLHVYRLGKIRIDIFIVGLDSGGNIRGVTTVAVET